MRSYCIDSPIFAEEVNNTTEETKLIEHNLEFFNIQPRSTLVVYKTDTAESLLGKNDVSNMKTFPVCDRVSSTSILLEEAKRARVTKKLSPGGEVVVEEGTSWIYR